MLDPVKVQEVFRKNETSEAIAKELSTRVRFRPRTNLNKVYNDLIRHGQRVVQPEYLQTFQELEDIGVGSLTIGRGGRPNRFLWNYNLKEVAKAALGQLPEVKELEEISPKRKRKALTSRRGGIKVRRKASRTQAFSAKKMKSGADSVKITIEVGNNRGALEKILTALKG